MPQEGKDRRSIPKKYFSVPTEASAVKHNFPATISDTDLSYLARRSAIGHRIKNKFTEDAFGKWFNVTSDVEGKAEAIEKLNEKIKLKENLGIAFGFAETWGYSLLQLGFVEGGISNDQREKEAPSNVTKGIDGIEYVNPVMKSRVSKWKEDKNPQSDTYGCILSYTLKRPNGDKEEEVEIHADRFLHWTRPNVWNTPEGASLFEALYNILLSYENATYGIAESLWQNVAPMRTLTFPDWLYEFYSDDQQDEFIADMETKFKDFNVKQSWLLLPGMKMEVVDTNKGMAIKDHVDFIENQISAGSGVSRFMLEGFPQGKITGSDINRDEYYLFISNKQRNYIEPFIRLFYDTMEEYKILPEGDYEIDWIPIKELSEKEIIEIDTLRYTSWVELGKAIHLFQQAKWNVIIEAGEIIITDTEGNVFGEDRVIKLPEEEEPEPPPVPPEPGQEEQQEPGADQSEEENQDPEYIERYEDLTVDWLGLLNEFRWTMFPLLADWEKKWLKAIDRLAGKHLEIGEDRLMGHDDQMDLVNAITKTNISSPKYKKSLGDQYTNIYDETQDLTVEQMVGANVIPTAPSEFTADDPKSRKWLATQSNLTYTNTDAEINKLVKQGLNEILSSGIRINSEADIKRFSKRLDAEVSKAFDSYEGNLRTMIRTETARIVVQSRGDTYEKLGLGESMYEILVNPDACPECIPLIGNAYTLDQVLTILPVHPNCRCDYVPITPESEAGL